MNAINMHWSLLILTAFKIRSIRQAKRLFYYPFNFIKTIQPILFTDTFNKLYPIIYGPDSKSVLGEKKNLSYFISTFYIYPSFTLLNNEDKFDFLNCSSTKSEETNSGRQG